MYQLKFFIFLYFVSRFFLYFVSRFNESVPQGASRAACAWVLRGFFIFITLGSHGLSAGDKSLLMLLGRQYVDPSRAKSAGGFCP